MELTDLKDYLRDIDMGDAVLFEGPDYADAIIGTSEDGRVVYQFDKMVECLMEHDGMDMEDAVDFVEVNSIGSLSVAGEKAPIVVYSIPL